MAASWESARGGRSRGRIEQPLVGRHLLLATDCAVGLQKVAGILVAAASWMVIELKLLVYAQLVA